MTDLAPIQADKDYKYLVTMEVEVEMVVPGSAILRVIENWDDTNTPVPRGGRGWRDTQYDLPDEEEVVRMLAWNLGIQSRALDQLDGWADIEDPMKVENPYLRLYEGRVEITDLIEFDRKVF